MFENGKLAEENIFGDFITNPLIERKLNSEFISRVEYVFKGIRFSYFLMEHFQGESLRSLFINKSPLDEAFARNCFAEIILAIDFFHNASIIYRKITPENIFINSQVKYQLLDIK